jgi:hypothetical protein
MSLKIEEPRLAALVKKLERTECRQLCGMEPHAFDDPARARSWMSLPVGHTKLEEQRQQTEHYSQW